MEGELSSADVRKLQSLVDEQEQAVQAGNCLSVVVHVLKPMGFVTSFWAVVVHVIWWSAIMLVVFSAHVNLSLYLSQVY